MNMENDSEIVSRTKKKQQVEELQKLGAALIALPAVTLDALGLPAQLLVAVRDAQRFTSHGAIRRQLQFIGKIMRKIAERMSDTEIAAVASYVSGLH